MSTDVLMTLRSVNNTIASTSRFDIAMNAKTQCVAACGTGTGTELLSAGSHNRPADLSLKRQRAACTALYSLHTVMFSAGQRSANIKRCATPKSSAALSPDFGEMPFDAKLKHMRWVCVEKQCEQHGQHLACYIQSSRVNFTPGSIKTGQ